MSKLCKCLGISQQEMLQIILGSGSSGKNVIPAFETRNTHILPALDAPRIVE